jgi:ABC-type Fe3+-hydroxamate transport system substrate-binding protein
LSYFVTSAPRIVSLVPSITELVVALGLGDYLVGRTGFCIHPAQHVQHIPKVGGTKDVNLAKIKQLAPTHVIVNVDENELATVQALRQFVPHVIVTHPQTPQDNLMLIDQMTQMAQIFAMNSEANYAIFIRANELKQQISLGLQRLQSVSHQQQHPQHPQRVLYLIWQEPWMTVARDTYISRMLDLIGWQTWPDVMGGETGAARYPVLSGNEAWLGQVERVLLSSEPYRFGAEHIRQVQSWLPQAKVKLVDGEMLSWYGSRAIQGLDYLAALAEESAASSSA